MKPTSTPPASGIFTAVAVVTAMLSLAGCSGSFAPSAVIETQQASVGTIQGTAHGGQSPIIGAHVYLYAAGTAGWGGASQSLLSPYSTGSFPTAPDSSGNYYVTTSAPNGGFSLSGEYSCRSGQQVYIYIQGGNSGAGSNPAIGLLAVVGQCPSSGSLASTVPVVTVNEATTIAAAYAISGFAVDPTHVSDDEGVTSNTTASIAQTGMANAFANAANLVSVATGAALTQTPAGNGVVPQAKIYTLANILASCVDADSPSDGGCPALFANATNSGAQPADTAGAAIDIAQNEGDNDGYIDRVNNLYALQTPTSPFAPTVTRANFLDMAIGISYSAPNFQGPAAIATDAYGNAWIANMYTRSQTPNYGGSYTKLSPTGAVLSGATGFSTPQLQSPTTVALDSAGNAWTNAENGYSNPGPTGVYIGASISEISNTGVVLSGANGFDGQGYNFGDIAIDGSGNAWFVGLIPNANGNAANLMELSPSGAVLSGGYPGGGVTNGSIAIDALGNIWTAGGCYAVSETASNGTPLSPVHGYTISRYAGSSCGMGIAIDASGNVWTPGDNYNIVELAGSVCTGGSGVACATTAGTVLSGTNGYPGGASIAGIAIDGAGSAWIVDSNSVAQLTPAGVVNSGSYGYGQAEVLVATPTGIALDASGNVWVSNAPNTGPGSVSEFIGAATPVVVPLATGIKYSKLGTRP